MSEITVIIKSSNADRTEVMAEPTMTVLEFKEKVAEKVSIEPAAQRLIYKGRVLKDECTLKFYDVQDGQTIHLVKGGSNGATTTGSAAPTPVAAPSSGNPMGAFGGANPFQGFGNSGAPGGMPGMPAGMNPEMMSQMMNNPMIESIMSNPDMLRNLIVNNPQMQSMLDSNPQIRHVLNDPAVSLTVHILFNHICLMCSRNRNRSDDSVWLSTLRHISFVEHCRK